MTIKFISQPTAPCVPARPANGEQRLNEYKIEPDGKLWDEKSVKGGFIDERWA